MANNTVDLKFLADSAPIVEANKRLNTLGRTLEGLIKKQNAGAISDKQFAKAKKELRRSIDDLYPSWNRAKSVVDNFDKSIRTNIRTLESQKQALKTSEQAAGQMGRRMSRTGVLFQQSGYQIGDFIVQVQSGQNAMIAFGQQATQMAGALTILGGKFLAIGTGLGVIIPLVTAFGAAWLKSRKAMGESKDATDELIGRIESLDRALDNYLRKKRASQIGWTVEQLTAQDSLDKATEDLAKAQGALLEVRASIAKGGTGFRDMLPFLGTFLDKKDLKDAQSAIRALEEDQTAAQNRIIAQRKRLSEEQAVDQAKRDRETLAGSIRAAEEARVKIAQAEIEAENEKVRREQAIIDERARQAQSNEIAVMTANINSYMDAWESGQKFVIENQEELNDLASVLGDRLGTSFATALQIIRAAKAEASVGLDAFGGGGDFKYDLPQTLKAPKTKTNKGGGASQQDPLARIRDRIKLDTELLGKTKERQEVERAIANSSKTYGKDAVDQAVAELAAYNQIVEKRQELQGIYDTAQSSMEDGFMAMVEGTKSVEDAFKDMARAIIKDLYQVYVVKRMVGSVEGGTGIAGILGGIFGKASGGTVQANQPYLVGEKGPELIVPRNRGHVMNADLTAGAMGGGGDVYVTNNFTMAANGDDSVKKIIAQSMPAIVNASKQGVMDARRRGGAMKNTFG